ncbi:MAG: hypothetical protein VYB44_07435 [Bacteroidota bacterium]|nr:hypothetical protein [Bacteroidota bacterium]
MLPKTLTTEQLAVWITDNSKEEFDDVHRDYFTEEQIIDMKDDSFRLGRELIDLEELKKKVVDSLTKGNGGEFTVDVPASAGITAIKKERKELDKKIAKGYLEIETRVYGIPSEDGYMHYFDIEGNEFEHRKRKLSMRENHEYNGMFAQIGETEVKVTTKKA